MEERLNQIINHKAPDAVFLFEHKSIYTAGTSANSKELLNKTIFPVVNVGRGGRFTYHGPGQRVIYPVVNLQHKKNLKRYLQFLENWIISTLAEFGLQAYVIKGKTGVWVKDKNNIDTKIASIGIRVRKWVAYHGIAVNIDTNLDNYSAIIPCGIEGVKMSSIKSLGADVKMAEFDNALKANFMLTMLG